MARRHKNGNTTITTRNQSRPIAPKMTEEASTGSIVRIVAGIMVAGLVISSILPLTGVLKNAVTDNGSTLVQEKLSKVPIFTVTDSTGRPYLSEENSGRLRRGFFFMQPADAEEYLQTVQKDTTDAKVLVIGLDNALNFVQNKGMSAKSVPEQFELFPDGHQLKLAQELTNGKFGKTFGKTAVPVFYLDGLAVKDDTGTGTVIPLFFEKEKLDESFTNLQKSEPSTDLQMSDVHIVDLFQTIEEIRSGGDTRFNRIVFIPLTEAIKSLNALSAKN